MPMTTKVEKQKKFDLISTEETEGDDEIRK